MPMTKDKDRLKKSHADGARILEAYLDQGKAVAFLTLGDPTVYSTYIYLHNIVKEAGYETEIVSGVTSFCAAAARLEMDIASKAQQIHIGFLSDRGGAAASRHQSADEGRRKTSGSKRGIKASSGRSDDG